jgi:hypothetical protein
VIDFEIVGEISNIETIAPPGQAFVMVLGCENGMAKPDGGS